MNLPVNLHQATFECTFGRGCNGICCKDGRPIVYPHELEKIGKNIEKFLPELRPEARTVVERQGFVSRRRKRGQPMVRVAGGWCVFFKNGCVLHRIGAAEGDKFRYKPWVCGIFPIDHDLRGRWLVRQKGFQGEMWDLFCLNPANSSTPAAESLRDELVFLQSVKLPKTT